MKNYTFTSECVSRGHPDKIADQISDKILDLCLKKFNQPKVAIETLVINDQIIIAGEISQNIEQDTEQFLKQQIIEWIKNDPILSQTYRNCEPKIQMILNKQSPDINALVDNSYQDNKKELGAGDQGMMYGYASNDTESLMPAAIFYARKIINHVINSNYCLNEKLIGPDMKTQISVYYENNQLQYIEKILISTQHDQTINQEKLQQIILPLILEAIPSYLINLQTEILINPAGKFTIGGPQADTGVTGRKIIVDTYGGAAPHGGGAFSGKDPTKVDRSASYMARYIAKNIVAAGVSDKCLVQIAYTIGITKPFSFWIDTFGTNKINISDQEITKMITQIIDITPSGIINKLNLWNINYCSLAQNGHFGTNCNLPWEQTDLANKIKDFLKLNILENSICNTEYKHSLNS